MKSPTSSITVGASNELTTKKTPRHGLFHQIMKYKWLYLLMMPGILYYIVFRYFPMYGILAAFQNYYPSLGFLGSKWVGFTHFTRFFNEAIFWRLIKNTFILGVYNLGFFFPAPIIIALLLNEVRRNTYKRLIQTVVYIPHFMSWVVVASITYIIFAPEKGVINNLLTLSNMQNINFLLSEGWFRPLIILQVLWKETGWGTIIFMAALTGVDVQLYEAAKMDGAGRWKQLWHITLPSIRSTIVILLILRLGAFLDTGFEQIFLMVNSMNREVGEVFDTYVYTMGVAQGQISYSTAIGLFKSVVGLILVVTSNQIAKKFGQEGIL